MKIIPDKVDGITLAREWMINSGIQNTEGINRGGFNSWYDTASGDYSYVYSEITGYGITTLLFLEKIYSDKEYLKRAIIAANWLASRAVHSIGGVKTRDYIQEMEEAHLYSFDSENIYAFDNAMVLYGMVNLYKRTQDKKFLEFSLWMGDFLVKRLKKDDGSFYAVYNAGTGEKEDRTAKWSTQSGSYHAKMALGFIDLFDATGISTYGDVAYDLCKWSMEQQDFSGRFITSRADSSTHLHPHCYTAAGLLYAGLYFGDEGFTRSAVKAMKWALDNVRLDGGIPKMYDGRQFNRNCRTDIMAQVLRLGVILYHKGRLEEAYRRKLDALRKALLRQQYLGDDSQKGGFFYGATLDGIKKKHINSWCSMFALQALIMYQEYLVENREIEKLELFV